MRLIDSRQALQLENRVPNEEDALLEQTTSALLVTLMRIWKVQADKVLDDLSSPPNDPPEATGGSAAAPVPV